MLRRVAFAMLACWLGTAAVARAEPRLEHHDRRALGLDSLLAASDDDEVWARLWARLRSGFVRRGVFGPDTDAQLGAALGVYETPRTSLDVDASLGAGWPELDGAGEIGDMPAIAGRLSTRGGFEIDLPARLRLELESTAAVETALDAERSVRPREVGPAPFRAAEVAPAAWLSWPLRGEEQDDERMAVAVGASARTVGYLAPGSPAASQGLHGWGAIGGRFQNYNRSDGFRGETRLPEIGLVTWSRPDAAPWRAVDFALRANFQLAGRRTRDHGGAVAIGADLGWVIFLEAYDDEGVVLNTADMGIDFTLTNYEMGSATIAIHHDPAVTPLGSPVGITSFELEGRLAPNDLPLGAALIGTVGRIVDIVSSHDDVWTFELGAELYVRIDMIELGIDGGAGRGSPTGSMGWDPFAGAPGYFGRGGIFARARVDWFDAEED